jgi:hypothetical protein
MTPLIFAKSGRLAPRRRLFVLGRSNVHGESGMFEFGLIELLLYILSPTYVHSKFHLSGEKSVFFIHEFIIKKHRKTP